MNWNRRWPGWIACFAAWNSTPQQKKRRSESPLQIMLRMWFAQS